jgi:hypothetical protein
MSLDHALRISNFLYLFFSIWLHNKKDSFSSIFRNLLNESKIIVVVVKDTTIEHREYNKEDKSELSNKLKTFLIIIIVQ